MDIMLPDYLEWIRPYLGDNNLNVGCGENPMEGFRNVDKQHWWIGEYSAPFRTDSIDCIFASHVMEHVKDIIRGMRDAHRILKPGGYFIALTPYASSDDAWEDPTHVRCFTKNSWGYFDKRLYARPGHLGHYKSDVDYIFEVEKVHLVVEPGWANYPDLEQAVKSYRNVIRELQVVLRAVKE
jgi:SAM-dependent methyltransferase